LRDALLRDEFYALTDLESDIAAYDGNLEALLSDIDEGFELQLSAGGLGLLTDVIQSRIAQVREQSGHVDALEASEHARAIAEAALAQVESRARQVELALGVQAVSELQRSGSPEDTAAADYLRSRLLTEPHAAALPEHLQAGEHSGPHTAAVTPAVSEEPLTRHEGETDAEFAARVTEQRERVIAGLLGAQSEVETDAWRNALDSVDPDLRRVWRDLQALEDLEFFEQIQDTEGARFARLAEYMEERAEPLEAIFADPVPAERIDALGASLRAAMDDPQLSGGQREILEQRLALLDSYSRLIHDPSSGAAHLVDPDNFESSFENWVRREGPAMAGGLALGVAAGLAASSVVGSAAAPGLAIAAARLVGTAAAISSGYHVGYNATDLALGTDAQAAIWGPTLRGELSVGDASGLALQEIATGTVFGAATMGASGVLLRNFERAATSVLTRWGADDVQRLNTLLRNSRDSGQAAQAPLWNRFVGELQQEGGQEVATYAIQAAAQAALGADPNNAAAAFGIAVMSEAALNGGRRWRGANAQALERLGVPADMQGRIFEIEGETGSLPTFVDEVRGAGANATLVAPNILMFESPESDAPSFVITGEAFDSPFGAQSFGLAEAVQANREASIPALRAASTVGRVESFESLADALPEGSEAAARGLMNAVEAGEVELSDITAVLDAQGTAYQVSNGRVVIDPMRVGFGGTPLNNLAARVGTQFPSATLVVDPEALSEGALAGYTDVDGRELGLSLRGLLTGQQSFVETHETHAHLRDTYRHGGALDIRVRSASGAPLTGVFESGPYAQEFSFQELLGAAHTARTLSVGPARSGEITADGRTQLESSVATGLAVAGQTRELSARALEALRGGAPLNVSEGERFHSVSFRAGDNEFALPVNAADFPPGADRDGRIRAALVERFAQVEERAHAVRGDFSTMESALTEENWVALRDAAQAAHRYASRQSAWVGDIPQTALAVDRAGWARAWVGPREADASATSEPPSLDDSAVSFSAILRRSEELGAMAANNASPARMARAAGDMADRAQLVAVHAAEALDAVNAGNFEIQNSVATVRYESSSYGERTLSFDLSGTPAASDPAAVQTELQQRLRLMTVTADGVRARAETLWSMVRNPETADPEQVRELAIEMQRVANADFGPADAGPGTRLGSETDVRIASYPTAVQFAESGLPSDLVEGGLAGVSLNSRLSEPPYMFDPLTGQAVVNDAIDGREGYEREIAALRWMSSAPPDRIAGMVRELR
ncbi:MAG: hypothetical protein AAFQ82_06770, partial [Myxococcota bacterium]